MSELVGTAFGGFGEIAGMALGDTEIDYLAIGGQIVWEKGSEIYGVVSIPAQWPKSSPFTVVVKCNRQTNYIMTYSNEGSTVISNTVTNITDTPDGKREITFTASFGTAGINRSIYIYGATKAKSVGYRSLNYKLAAITIT